jgi:DNA-binding LacI/PurR family transcriptional regulator
MAATLHDVAREAGVSIKTVSNVVNSYPYVRETTATRVRAAIDKLGYTPNFAARNLRSGRKGVIGLIIPDLRNTYFAELAAEVMLAAERHGLAVLIDMVQQNRESETAALKGSRIQMTDGVLYSALSLDREDLTALDISTPMVLLGDRIFDGPTDHVTIQNTEAARAATTHLLETGRRRILAIGAHPGEVLGSAGLRMAGYQQALAEAGIAYDPALVIPAERWLRSDGAAAMAQALESKVKFDAVFAFNDLMAFGAIRTLQDAGYSIPTDVAVVGFDDVDEARYSSPPLTSIDPGRAEIAERAVVALIERMGATTTGEPREYPVAFRLVTRESTAADSPSLR